ncbi:MFS transporter [Micromonospora sp. M12]
MLAIGRPAGLPVLVAAVAVLGVAFAGMQLLPFSMLPDVIRAATDTDETPAGTYTGVWTATEATGAALGPYAYALCLAVGGFVASAPVSRRCSRTRRSRRSATASAAAGGGDARGAAAATPLHPGRDGPGDELTARH